MRSKSRALVLTVSVLGHLGLLAAFISSTAVSILAPNSGEMYVSLHDGEAPAPQYLASTPQLTEMEAVSRLPDIAVTQVAPSEIEPLLISRSLPDSPPTFETEVEVADLTAAAPAASPRALAKGETCALTQWLQGALQADPNVRGALSAIPREARSVANAIMLWDGRWVATPAVSAAQSGAIRDAIIQGVRSAPDVCRDELMRGPLLLAVPDRFGTTLLAVGSGAWKWSDLLPESSKARS